MPSDMKAVTISQFGGPEELHLSSVPIPKPAPHEVQIQIEYTAVNPVDWKVREGYLSKRLPHHFPLIPGWDAAGKISSVGSSVKNFKVGDEVYAYCRKDTVEEGTYAQFITVAAENVARKPKNINFAEAASIPLAGLTAWQALFDVGKLQKGQTALIHAGAGGVGSLAIQLAKWAGAKVITTASQDKADYVKKLGADLIIDYQNENFVDRIKKACPKGIDLVFDMIGGETLAESATLLKKGGVLVSLLEKLDEAEVKSLGIHSEYVFVRPNGQELADITDLVEKGFIQVPFLEEMPLRDAAKAQEKVRQGHTKGKIVLRVG